MKSFFSTVLALLFLFSASAHNKKEPVNGWYVSNFEQVLGTSMELKLALSDPSKSELAEQTALAEIDRLNAILSSYDPNSEWSRWQATKGQSVKISPELMEVMQLFDQWKQKTQGALNPAVGLLANLWKAAEKQQVVPSVKEISGAVNTLQSVQWNLDVNNQSATHIGAAPLLFNSFVKSFIIQKAAQKVAVLEGVQSLVLNIGGDLIVAGKYTETVGIADPRNPADNAAPFMQLKLQNLALATSGNYKRGYSIKGKWYSHIIDPRNGQPASSIISATVAAKDPVVAGALATAFTILSPAEISKVAAENGHPAYCLVTREGTVIKSENWKEYELGTVEQKNSLVASPLQKSWKKGFEVQVQLELARFEGRSRRPFVAVWVENSQGETVKTLALWYNKPRWLPDLKEWYHQNSQRYAPEAALPMSSISSATRPAGSYLLKWDGKDEKGEWVKNDNYTVLIEVAREHGTYQLIKQEISCKNKEVEITLPANTEVASASLSYKKSKTAE